MGTSTLRRSWKFIMVSKKTAPYLIFFYNPDVVIINNWLKDIASAFTKYISFVTYYYYSKHLYNKVKHKYGEVIAQKFWECVYAKTEPTFDKVLSENQKLSDKIVKYISRLSRKQ